VTEGDIVYKQEKSDDVLDRKAEEIIGSLKDFNLVEKIKIIRGLYFSLIDVILDAGGAIIIEDKKEGS
jgi:hypothetical protein